MSAPLAEHIEKIRQTLFESTPLPLPDENDDTGEDVETSSQQEDDVGNTTHFDEEEAKQAAIALLNSFLLARSEGHSPG